MASGINITTLTGERFDVDSSANLELNMGGISFLNGLADRTVTYSNSFKMPYTPNNHKLFGFASMPTRNNRPKIDVIIQKGIFQKRAVLTVLNADKGYNCSVSYDWAGVVNNLKGSTLDFYFAQASGSSSSAFTEAAALTAMFNLNQDLFCLATYGHYAADINENYGHSFSKFSRVFSEMKRVYGFKSTMPSAIQGYMDELCVPIPNYNIRATIQFPGWYLSTEKNYDFKYEFTLSELLKVFCQIYALNMAFDGDTVSFTEIGNISQITPINIEGFENINKKTDAGLGLNNYIKYKISDDAVSKYFGADYFVSTGVETKDVLEINNVVPKNYAGTYFGYDLKTENPLKKIMLMKPSDPNTYQVARFPTAVYVSAPAYIAKPLTMSGFYSGILNGMFENPVILEATKWIDPLKANDIMTTRVINSVQLGGKYWVDSMQYSLVSGKSKLTLIKIQ